jgi:hypothetical protein
MATLLGAFKDTDDAVKAAGALLDHGVGKKQLDLLVGKAYADTLRVDSSIDEKSEKKAEHGITTTTGKDAAEGAKKGAGAGAVVGVIAGLASLFIPGYGLVAGGGALATAIGAAVGTTAAGAAAGGGTGYLKDMGVDADVAKEFDEVVRKDGAVVAVTVPHKDITEAKAQEIMEKYGAFRVSSSHHSVV